MVLSMRCAGVAPGMATQSRCDGVGSESRRYKPSGDDSSRGEGFSLLED